MKLPSGHLTYCTNIHRGESLADLTRLLAGELPEIKRLFCPTTPFGVGLRLSAQAVDAALHPAACAALKAQLADAGLYVFTVNAFPYGPFHGKRVKEEVYLPDWQDEERLRYTDAAADLLAELLPDGMQGSLSTVPGAYKAAVVLSGPALMADMMLRHVAHLVWIERLTGKFIALAIEPEPCCFMETTEEAVQFFEEHLFSASAISRLASLTGSSAAEAAIAVRAHVGLCLDLCHAAVEFEEPAEVFGRLRGAGITVPKLQISAGLSLPHVGRDTPSLLAPFDDGVYLHQVVERRTDGLHRYSDLRQAFAALKMSAQAPEEWRVHYHVPLFLDDLGSFRSTQGFVREALRLHRAQAISDHLEIETYTWDVLPPEYRTTGIVPAITRELQWVHQQLIG